MKVEVRQLPDHPWFSVVVARDGYIYYESEHFQTDAGPTFEHYEHMVHSMRAMKDRFERRKLEEDSDRLMEMYG